MSGYIGYHGDCGWIESKKGGCCVRPCVPVTMVTHLTSDVHTGIHLNKGNDALFSISG